MGAAKLTTMQTTFASGELDSTLRGQKDIKAYSQGARKLRNVQRRSTGGVERRFGTYDLASLGGQSRFEGFEFSSAERYIVAFQAGQLQVFDTGGALLQNIFGAPWATFAIVREMTTAQLGDVMVICHGGFWPVILRRTSASTFTLTDLAFEASSSNELIYQPYYKFEDPAITLTLSGATGAITVTAKDAAGAAYNLFEAGHVGLRFRVYDVEVQITSLASASVANATVLGTAEGTLDIDPFKVEKGSLVVTVTHLYHGLKTGQAITFSGANDTGSIPAANFNGSKTITVVDEHHYKFTLAALSYNYWEDHDGDGTPTSRNYTSARISEDGGGPNVKFSVAGLATRRWMEPSISAVRGYPAACTFHQMRLGLGGTDSQPDGVFLSSALQFFRFDAGKGYDGDSVQVAIGDEDVSRIRHLISAGDLIMLTATSESAFQVRDGEAITPNNARVKTFTKAGCSAAQPTEFDGAVLFAQENGLTAYEFTWSDSLGKYLATPISTLSALINNPVQVACTPGMTARAEQFAFWVNADGTVAVFHSMRSENIAGWALWSIADVLVESVCCLGSDVFFAVNRSGARRLYRLATADLISLDGCVHHSGAPSTTWTVDARVRNRSLSVVSERGYHGVMAIPGSGIITLNMPVQNVVVGSAFYPEVETLPPVLALPSGERSGMTQRLVRSIIDFHQSLAPTVEGVPIQTFDSTEAVAAISAWDGPYEMYHMGYERDPTLTLSQNAPLAPWRVLSVLQEVAV